MDMSALPAAATVEPGVADKKTPPPAPPPAPSGEAGAGPAAGEATLLVSEFPPPPFYYRQYQTLTPPPIPHEALERGTNRSAAAAAQARAESERLRLLGGENQDNTLAGTVPTDPSGSGATANGGGDDNDGSVVGVFGEIVEDPVLFQPLDRCEDPRVVRDEVKRLNNEAVKGFVELVRDLVHRPMENKYEQQSKNYTMTAKLKKKMSNLIRIFAFSPFSHLQFL